MAEPWYADGLRFACTQCGRCCAGEPGFVWVNDEEIAAIAAHRHEPVHEVFGLYTRREGPRRALKEKANNECIFYDRQAGCTIYPVRPRQCRTWPFWESNLQSHADWQRTASECPGCERGDLISSEEITQRLKVIRI